MAIDPDDERRMRRNWSLLKQEIQVNVFVQKFVEDGIFPPNIRAEIMNVLPNTASMKAEKFLNAVIQAGQRGYTALCRFLQENPDNRYSRIMDALNIPRRNAYNAFAGNGQSSGAAFGNAANARPVDSRPSTAVSSTSSGTINSETGEKHRRTKTQGDIVLHEPGSGNAPIACVAPQVAYPIAPRPAVHDQQVALGPQGFGRSTIREDNQNHTPQALFIESRIGESIIGSSRASQSEMSIASYNSDNSDSPSPRETTPQASGGEQQRGTSNAASDTPVDIKVLEKELVRIAPTIADLFKKIAVQTSSVPSSEEELRKVKDENERLRKTNKSLIEKLNAFQQKIIQLQLDNKKLKENGEIEVTKQEELKKKAVELQDMERRLEEHKLALQEKEQELNTQLEKLKEIEEENEAQRQKIDKLEEMQDEGIMERNMQQEQISILVEEKERQKDQIVSLEEQQKIGEHRLYSLEERLKMLEQGAQRRSQARRVGQPPPSRNSLWMNGPVERSHHANVKYQSEIKFDPQKNGKRRSSPTGKTGWPFI